MKVMTTKTKVYKFNELPEEGREKAIEKLYDINTDYDWYYSDGLLDLSADEMKDRRIKLSDNWHHGNIPGEYPAYTGLIKYSENIYFEIDRGSYIQFNDIEVTDNNIFRKFLRIPKKLWNNCYWYFDSPHSQCNTELIIEPDFESERDFTEKEQAIIDRAIGIMADKFDEALDMIKSQYDYITSEEGIIETIELNDYDFTIDGDIF